MIELLHTDCMAYMATLPDKAFDLCICDPPYGLPEGAVHARNGWLKGRAIQAGSEKMKTWDSPPSQEYFDELFRVSKDQIIWGGNHFSLPPCRGPIVWDKCQPWENFAQVEIAWCSVAWPAQLFRLDNRTGGKIHPTQKPVALYRWLLKNYAKPGQSILDTHLGSGSIAIACDIEGFDLTATEIDADYIAGARKRLADHQSQPRLFAPERAEQPVQLSMDPAA